MQASATHPLPKSLFKTLAFEWSRLVDAGVLVDTSAFTVIKKNVYSKNFGKVAF